MNTNPLIRLMTILITGFLLMTQYSAAQNGTWEMRVCTPPNEYPLSSQSNGGVNLDVARILADELGAEATFFWTPIDDRALSVSLMRGDCDIVIGIGDDAGGSISTVPFARIPYVFVSREDSAVAVTSFDDPELPSLRIGTYISGVPALALANRNITENVSEFAPLRTERGVGWDLAIMEAIDSGELDLGIVFAVGAAAYAAESSAELRITPVTPEIDFGPSLIQLYRTWTIGLRPHDTAFRDQLNYALAARWDDIQEAIASYGIRQLSVQRPLRQHDLAMPGIAIIAPTSQDSEFMAGELGLAAMRGAELAENTLALQPGSESLQSKVYYADAPDTAAAARAANRFIETVDLVALIGGFSAAETELLSEIAEKNDTLFFNIGSPQDYLRSDYCNRNAFHIEASHSMYLATALDWLARNKPWSLYIVHESSPSGLHQLNDTLSSIHGPHFSVVGQTTFGAGSYTLAESQSEITALEPDVLLLLAPANAQDILISQLPQIEGMSVITLPFPANQFRSSLYRQSRFRQQGIYPPNVYLWDATLEPTDDQDINQRFVARFGEPMEPTSWAAYAAVSIASEAAAVTGTTAAPDLIHYLESPDASFSVGKELPVSFHESSHQLQQELYLVHPSRDGVWSTSPFDQIEFGTVIGQSFTTHLPEPTPSECIP